MTRPPRPPAGPSPLAGAVRALVRRAGQVYEGGPAMPGLHAAARRLDEPLRVAIAGRIKAGKSTLLNALVGQELAATGAGECTRIVTWYRDGHTYRVMAHPRSGPPRPLPPGPSGGVLGVSLGGLRAEAVDRLVVDWPSAALATMTLVDTPGLDSLSTELSRRAESALGTDGEDEQAEVDAVVYLMRHVHGSDVRFLETFRNDPAERRPVNTIAVLGRADEVGHGRIDALDSAARVAARYQQDPRLQALCQTVLPVAGLLAATAATLREDEFRAITTLARAGEAGLGRLLVTAARFTGAETSIAVDPACRAALLDRFGFFGLRLSVRLVQSGVAATATALSRELSARAGLAPLRDALTGRFAGRADVLKARSALLAVDAVLQRWPVPAAAGLRHEYERITAGAHEFAEIRLLDTLRAGALMLTDPEKTAACRVLGGDGAAPASRLAVDPQCPPGELHRAAIAALAQWQRRAEHPSSTRDVREAARVLVRTCEGLVLGAQPHPRAGAAEPRPPRSGRCHEHHPSRPDRAGRRRSRWHPGPAVGSGQTRRPRDDSPVGARRPRRRRHRPTPHRPDSPPGRPGRGRSRGRRRRDRSRGRRDRGGVTPGRPRPLRRRCPGGGPHQRGSRHRLARQYRVRRRSRTAGPRIRGRGHAAHQRRRRPPRHRPCGHLADPRPGRGRRRARAGRR